MKVLPLTLSILALAVSAGCAQTRSAMGAGPGASSATGSTATGSTGSTASATRLVCRDGRWTEPGGSCANHGGTERVLSSQ